MKLQSSNPNSESIKQTTSPAVNSSTPPELQERTFGQKLADNLAAKVGSWPFLIGQSTVLAAWVGCNLTPGMPHWDESPFILLNLVFSFASAYTAPIVLMSQNRQSDEDRAHAKQHYEMNLQTAQNLEVLHQKMDQLYTQKLSELTNLVQQQHEAKVLFTSNQPGIELGVKATSEGVAQPSIPGYIGLLPSNIAQVKESFWVLPVEATPAVSQTSVTPTGESMQAMNDQN